MSNYNYRMKRLSKKLQELQPDRAWVLVKYNEDGSRTYRRNHKEYTEEEYKANFEALDQAEGNTVIHLDLPEAAHGEV